MSLAIFSTKNAFHRNGKLLVMQVFGGGPKLLIKQWDSTDMMLSESGVEYYQINFTMQGRLCFIAVSLKLQILLIYWVSILK